MVKARIMLGVCGVLVGTTILSSFLLASSIISASTATSNVAVSVPVSCNITSTLDSAHSATVNPATYQDNIGTTTFKVFCNDNTGFAIYAVGYSNEEYGNNKLLATVGGVLTPSSDIVTGTATSGSTSNWAMKLTPVTTASSGTTQPYTPTIENGYNNYNNVPSEWTKVATHLTNTDFTIGSSLQSTYAVYVDGLRPAGTYAGKVRYTLVHPNDAPTPNAPVVTNPGYISYNPNAAGVTDTMGDQSITITATSANLWASNFRRDGYGFAGWSDKFDWVLNANDTNGNGTGPNAGYHIYGPNETISFTAGQYSGDNKGLSLYAVWVPSAGNLQSWSGCSAMTNGQVTALTDTRDSQTYSVAKLKDGNCWMIENLRLDNEYTVGAENEAKAQGYAKYSGTGTNYGDFIGLADPENTLDWSSSPAYPATNSLYYSGTQSGTATIDIGTSNNPGYRFPRYNNQNTASPATNMTAWNNNANTYSVGNWYNWSAAMANTKYYYNPTAQVDGATSENAGTSICPKGWKLPYGNSTGNGATSGGFYYLNYKLNNDTNTTDSSSSLKWRSYPNNFIYSGRFERGSPVARGISGFYWSSTVSNINGSCALALYPANTIPSTDYSFKYMGESIRCLAQ